MPSSASISATLAASVGDTHWSSNSFTGLPARSERHDSQAPKFSFAAGGQP